MTRNNIIGEDLKDFLVEEINNRQRIHGSGFNGNRSERHISYLFNRNSWIKMGSSVIITDPSKLSNPLFKNINKGMGLTEKNSYLGVIHNLKVDKGLPDRSTFNLYKEKGINPNALDFYGNVPPPGIESFEVKTLNRGSIRKGTLKMKAFSKAQFDVIDFLFFRPGYSIMVEWGWGTGIDNNDKIIEYPRDTILDDFWWDPKSENTSQLSMIGLINNLRERFKGNYDGFFGKVSNFEWSMGKDGTYEIILSLITMGDVIESLNLNIAPQYVIVKNSHSKINLTKNETSSFGLGVSNPEENSQLLLNEPALRTAGDGRFLADANIVKGAESNHFCNILYQKISNKTYLDNTEYYSLEDSIDAGYLNQAIDDRYNYYLSFSELIWNIEFYLLPSIVDNTNNPKVSEKIIIFDENISNDGKIYIPVFPNQIALDPTICIFEHKENIGYNKITNKINNKGETESKGELMYVPLGLSEDSSKIKNKGKKFIEEINIDNEIIRVGNLNNLFINFDFVSKCILEGVDEKGEMNLFNFLKNICNGINKSLGNVNQIEPVLKDDKIITFIDKQSIPGTKKFRNNKGIKDRSDYDIDLWGYNADNKERITSNFVKDFNFKTKITPQMASQISIGTTAQGSNTSTINGTIFENWNRGLKDKFNQYSVNPSPYTNMESEEVTRIKTALLNIKKYNKIEVDNYFDKDENGKFKSYNKKEQIEAEQEGLANLINNINEAFVINDYGYYLIEAFAGEQYINTADNLEKVGVSKEDIDEVIKNYEKGSDIVNFKKRLQEGNVTAQEMEDFREKHQSFFGELWDDVMRDENSIFNSGNDNVVNDYLKPKK